MCNHFNKILGISPVNNHDHVIPEVLGDIEIYDGPFTINELQVVKKSMKKGKSGRTDNISVEVINRCNLNNTNTT